MSSGIKTWEWLLSLFFVCLTIYGMAAVGLYIISGLLAGALIVLVTLRFSGRL